MLYQLSYTPKQQILSFIELPYEHRDTALETVILPAELYPYIRDSYIIFKLTLIVKQKNKKIKFFNISTIGW